MRNILKRVSLAFYQRKPHFTFLEYHCPLVSTTYGKYNAVGRSGAPYFPRYKHFVNIVARNDRVFSEAKTKCHQTKIRKLKQDMLPQVIMQYLLLFVGNFKYFNPHKKTAVQKMKSSTSNFRVFSTWINMLWTNMKFTC